MGRSLLVKEINLTFASQRAFFVASNRSVGIGPGVPNMHPFVDLRAQRSCSKVTNSRLNAQELLLGHCLNSNPDYWLQKSEILRKSLQECNFFLPIQGTRLLDCLFRCCCSIERYHAPWTCCRMDIALRNSILDTAYRNSGVALVGKCSSFGRLGGSKIRVFARFVSLMCFLERMQGIRTS